GATGATGDTGPADYRSGASTWAGASARTITFSSALPSTAYQIQITDVGTLGANTSGCYSISSQTTTSITIRPKNCSTAANINAPSAFNWFVIMDK
ncbi:MAG: hypothetical protein AABZ80_10975, partial [Gemmatimonadota bacterium]